MLPGQDICDDRWNHSYLAAAVGAVKGWHGDYSCAGGSLERSISFHHDPSVQQWNYGFNILFSILNPKALLVSFYPQGADVLCMLRSRLLARDGPNSTSGTKYRDLLVSQLKKFASVAGRLAQNWTEGRIRIQGYSNQDGPSILENISFRLLLLLYEIICIL